MKKWQPHSLCLISILIAGAIVLFGAAPSQPQNPLKPSVLYVVLGKQLTSISLTSKTITSPAFSPKLAQLEVYHLFDWNQIGRLTRFLVSLDSPTATSSYEAPSKYDLVVLDSTGKSTSLSRNVTHARLSPDAGRVAYATYPPRVLHIATVDGERIKTIEGASDPYWSSDGQKVVYTQAPTNDELTEERNIAVFDLAHNTQHTLTHGQNDFSPIFHPSGNFVLFLSGSRTGLASFWAVPSAGGVPWQLTNIDLRRVDEHFIPTPFKTVAWSPDGMSLAYDRLDSTSSTIWVLKFAPGIAKVSFATRVGEGLWPHWLDNSRLIALDEKNAPKILEMPR
jgi:Tol biopolymer transport system component